MNLVRKQIGIWGLAFIVVGMSYGIDVSARALFKPGTGDNQSAAAPAYKEAIHQIGKIVLTITNYGVFGEGYARSGQDAFTGDPLQSCEYPKGSRTTYLYTAAFWVGAVVGRDTLVSTGGDGWSTQGNEFHPDIAKVSDMKYRSIIDPSSGDFDGAISEEDFVSVYYDTCLTCDGVSRDEIDGRSHRPLRLEITEKSYAWSYAYAESFVLFDYAIRNNGVNRLKRVYLGFYVDADVQAQNNPGGFDDDICGFRQSLPAFYSTERCQWEDTINIAWIADNDGDLTGTPPVPHVTGTRIIRTPSDSLEVSFNWWVSNGDAPKDFGPRLRSDSRVIGTGGEGTPAGDRNKYAFLKNKEFDYDQVYTASITAQDTLWKTPPQTEAPDIADGFDTRYLLSFGPFDIEPGQTLPLSFSYVGGQDFHYQQSNKANLPYNPDGFYRNVDFSDFGYNAIWSSWIYDNPGYDTDADGYAGISLICNAGNDSTCCWYDTTYDTLSINPPAIDTIYSNGYIYTVADTVWKEGDGVPDFQGATPPPAPIVRVFPTVGKVDVRFNGLRSETTRDVFSRALDFEGYRVYSGRDDRRSSYSMLQSYDRKDYSKYVWNPRISNWVLREAPFSPEALKCLYALGGCNDTVFNPLSHGRNNPFEMSGFPDSLFYFVEQDYNRSEFGVTTDIKKVYPDQPYPFSLSKDSCRPYDTTNDITYDTLSFDPFVVDTIVDNGGFFKFFEYTYAITDLLPTVPYYINVTAFDFGSPKSGLASLETSPTVNAKVTYALEGTAKVLANDLKVFVYPNPYRIDGEYRKNGFEGRGFTERPDDRVRAVHFGNLPPKCTITIYTIDGDLVREIKHDMPISDPLSNHDYWDLITRNTQLAVSGLYYWTVEGSGGSVQMGKLVLIM